MRNLLDDTNLAFCVAKSIETGHQFAHIFVTRRLSDHHSVSLKEVNYVLPLYSYTASDVRLPNLTHEFVDCIQQRLGLTMIRTGLTSASSPIELELNANKGQSSSVFVSAEGLFAPSEYEVESTRIDIGNTFTPEEFFGYAYAVLNCPTYRIRYSEFLRLNFPRLLLTSDVALFRKLCAMGSELVGLHLMETPLTSDTKLYGKGENVVEILRYEEAPAPMLHGGEDSPPGRVIINKTQYFAPVPPEVYAFHIGGYQVCNKWLKDRKGRTLSAEDVTHYAYIVEALKRTIDVMARIDEVIEEYGGFPLA